ncbi:hypothetical protein RRG08_035443 [Elysia crispata]|uniref:C2H2-type domain-containing protein n=1 Tax=Elysia crispata TaxID=231223 RepID=A0AAE0Y3Z7_9GAST|nr:hypothetical protein RRG08_035443 [Elysia crispata]
MSLQPGTQSYFKITSTKMDLVDNSSHMCLICNQTVIGLYNYVEHFKSHATAQESKVLEATFTDEKTCVNVSRSSNANNEMEGRAERDLLSGASSPLCELPLEFTDPGMETGEALDQNACSDFFQSLELKSISEEAPSNARMKAVQRLSILEDDSQAELLLPITSILSNLDFSSDDEFFGISDNEDGDENFWLNDDGESQPHPPSGHRGGKWKPGEGPKQKMPIASKWRPGQKPGPACRKNILRKPAKVKGAKAGVVKSFYCNVCHSFFMDRSTYSLHFGQSRHQEMAAAKKKESFQQSSLKDGHERVAGQAGGDMPINSGKKEMQSETTNPAKTKDDFYCQDCNLYFNNAVVFATHCETKLHRDAILKKGFRDIRGGGGEVFRIDINTDTVHKERSQVSTPSLTAVETAVEPEVHECPICIKSFTRKYEMARHLLTRMHAARARHHPQATSVEMLERYNKYMVRLMPFQCGVCRFYFNKQKDFLDHMGSKSHLQTCEDLLGPILCVPCKFKTHKHDEMMEHLQYPEHHSAVEKKFGICVVKESHTRITCKFCGLHMHSAVRMNQHCIRKHKDRMSNIELALDVKPLELNFHKCPLCEKKFKAKSLLQLHFLKVHKHKYLFNCNVCKRGFLDQRRLDNHLRTRFHAKRVVASKIREKNGTQSTSNPEGQTKGTGHRRSGRKRKAVKFFDSDEDQSQTDLDTVKVIKNSQRIEATKKPSVGSKTKSDERRKSTKTRVLNQRISKQEKMGTEESHSQKVAQNLDDCDPDMEIMNGNQHSVETKSKGMGVESSLHTEEEDEDLILEEEAEEDEGELIPGNEDEVEREEHARVNEASLTIFSCTYCEFAATDLLELRAHYSSSHPQEILTCQPCDQYFLSLKAYKIHCSGRGHQLKLREMTGETTIHKCKVCDKRFLQEFSCRLHLETVHRHPSSEEDLKRLHKGQDLVSQLYGEHIRQVETLNNENSVSCPECGKFVRKDTLVEHLRLHTGERPYACRFCGRGFAGRLTLRRHLSGHLNMPLFMCDLCGKGFKRNGLLQRHIKQHEYERRGEKHTCHICKAWFYTPEELERHSRRHGDRKFHCTWPGCNWSFILAGELKSHMFTHTKEKRFLCDQCGFGAPTKTRLRRHAKSHLQTRAFVCEYCPYKASCKTHLRRHMRIHINSRPFACPYCKYTCNTHENMRKHILRTQKHKGKKLYPCPLCKEYGSNSSREFKAHLMTVHADYLKENAVDSLAVFSGLYKREEDFQKPKEGSEIIQVTKGRFFRSYQNPGSASNTVKDKKGKSKPGPAVKKAKVRVKIVPPEEIHKVLDVIPETDTSQGQGYNQTRQKHQDLQQQQPLNNLSNTQQQHPQLQAQLSHYQSQSQQNTESRAPGLYREVEGPAQYTEVTPLIIRSFTPQSQIPQNTPFSSNVSVMHQQQLQHVKQEHQQLQSVALANKTFWTLNPENMRHNHNLHQQHPNVSNQNHQHGHHYQSIPHSQQQKHQPQLSKVTQSVTAKLEADGSGRHIPSPEPWYSGMPQVHAPSSQELQQSYRTVSQISTAETFHTSEAEYHLSQISEAIQPQHQTIEETQSVLTSSNQIYTINVVDNVRLITQEAKAERPVALSTNDKPMYFSG